MRGWDRSAIAVIIASCCLPGWAASGASFTPTWNFLVAIANPGPGNLLNPPFSRQVQD